MPFSINPLQEGLDGITDNETVGKFFQSASSAAAASSSSAAGSSNIHGGTRKLIIMDEVDGMSTGDVGGNAELIKIIKATRTPIICICNDRSKPSVRSLANSCFDLKFARPPTPVIRDRVLAIASAEGLTVEPKAVEQLVESCGSDIRQVLNTLQMLKSQARSSLSAVDVNRRIASLSKDSLLRMDAASATTRLFAEARKLSVEARSDLFFVDYDMIPLYVQQAYLNAVGNGPEMERMQRTAKAAACISDGDIFSDYVRSKQAWGLLPSVAAANSRAAVFASGNTGFLMFPTWLGKNSSRNKRARLLAELGLRMAGHVSGGREAIRLDYLDPLRISLLSPLTSNKDDMSDIITSTIAALDEYGLSKTDMMETMIEVALPGDASNPAPDWPRLIDSKTKSALTREYNKTPHRAQSLSVPAGERASFAVPSKWRNPEIICLSCRAFRAGAVAAVRGGRARGKKISVEGEEVEDGGLPLNINIFYVRKVHGRAMIHRSIRLHILCVLISLISFT